MKPFRRNLKVVINKYLCGMHKFSPCVDFSSNDGMLIGMSEYIYFYPLNTINFEFLHMMFLKYYV